MFISARLILSPFDETGSLQDQPTKKTLREQSEGPAKRSPAQLALTI
jgi:hypothetical protein